MSEGIAATPRLSPQAAAAATAPVATPVVLVELDFASGPIRAWTGLGPLHWAGTTYEGMGTIGAVSDIEETAELRAVRITLTLSPVPQEVVDIALAEQSFRLRPARLWGALLDAEGAFVADPFPLWAGLMDTMQVVDGAEPRISLTCESRLVDLERAEVRRYTDADQQAEYPGDRFYLRERFFSLGLFADLGAIIEGCCDAWNRLVAEPGCIASLTDYPYLRPVRTSYGGYYAR